MPVCFLMTERMWSWLGVDIKRNCEEKEGKEKDEEEEEEKGKL